MNQLYLFARSPNIKDLQERIAIEVGRSNNIPWWESFFQKHLQRELTYEEKLVINKHLDGGNGLTAFREMIADLQQHFSDDDRKQWANSDSKINRRMTTVEPVEIFQTLRYQAPSRSMDYVCKVDLSRPNGTHLAVIKSNKDRGPHQLRQPENNKNETAIENFLIHGNEEERGLFFAYIDTLLNSVNGRSEHEAIHSQWLDYAYSLCARALKKIPNQTEAILSSIRQANPIMKRVLKYSNDIENELRQYLNGQKLAIFAERSIEGTLSLLENTFSRASNRGPLSSWFNAEE